MRDLQVENSQKRHIKVMKNLVSIGPRLNKIQLLINLNIYKRCMDCRTHRPDVYIFLCKFWSF